MRIDPKSNIAGVPILEVRRLLQSVSNDATWGKSYIVRYLGVPAQMAGALLAEMEQRGYIERSNCQNGEQVWHKTVLGSALGLASAAKPILRKTADRIFKEFMQRVDHINANPRFLVSVKKVVLFGSYLSDSPRVNDIDIAVEYEWKKDHPCFGAKDKSEAALQYAEAAEKEGKRFRTFLDRLSWPEDQVRLYLKSRSRALSLHPIEDGILDLVVSKVVYGEL